MTPATHMVRLSPRLGLWQRPGPPLRLDATGAPVDRQAVSQAFEARPLPASRLDVAQRYAPGMDWMAVDDLPVANAQSLVRGAWREDLAKVRRRLKDAPGVYPRPRRPGLLEPYFSTFPHCGLYRGGVYALGSLVGLEEALVDVARPFQKKYPDAVPILAKLFDPLGNPEQRERYLGTQVPEWLQLHWLGPSITRTPDGSSPTVPGYLAELMQACLSRTYAAMPQRSTVELVLPLGEPTEQPYHVDRLHVGLRIFNGTVTRMVLGPHPAAQLFYEGLQMAGLRVPQGIEINLLSPRASEHGSKSALLPWSRIMVALDTFSAERIMAMRRLQDLHANWSWHHPMSWREWQSHLTTFPSILLYAALHCRGHTLPDAVPPFALQMPVGLWYNRPQHRLWMLHNLFLDEWAQYVEPMRGIRIDDSRTLRASFGRWG